MNRALLATLLLFCACDSSVDECPEHRFAVTQYLGAAIEGTAIECTGSVTGPCDDIADDPSLLMTLRLAAPVCDATALSLRGEGNARFVEVFFYLDDTAAAQIVDARDDDDSSEASLTEPGDATIELEQLDADTATGRFDLYFDDGRITGTFDYHAPPDSSTAQAHAMASTHSSYWTGRPSQPGRLLSAEMPGQARSRSKARRGRGPCGGTGFPSASKNWPSRME